MPKRNFEITSLEELSEWLNEQCGTGDPVEVSKKAFWECPACNHLQRGEDLGKDNLHHADRTHTISTKCLSCGYSCEHEPDRSELEIHGDGGFVRHVFRPYTLAELEAHMGGKT